MSADVTVVEYDGVRFAIIVRKPVPEGRVQFFTPDDAALQVGTFRMKKGEEIPPHIHRECERRLRFTTEVLIIQKGALGVSFYDSEHKLRGNEVLNEGDLIILFEGGHGFHVREDLAMLEIKQGPYAGELDKVRFARPGTDQEQAT